MKILAPFLLVMQTLLPAVAAPPETSWTKSLKDRSKRGTLHDAYQFVRGDTGKWNDDARLQRLPPVQRRPARVRLDDWAAALLEKSVTFNPADDNWLLFHSRQLNDHDRLWVERIERRGNRFTITAAEAVWTGKYFKNFTYHSVIGVNLGKLKPGTYSVTWRVRPLVFERFEAPDTPRTRQNNWPGNERAADKKSAELTKTFTVGAAAASAKSKPVAAKKPAKWTFLFDGKTLAGWTKTKFGGEGTVEVKNGQIILGYGSNITGVHTKRKLPTINYEVQLEAMRVDGSDFFCGLTFPVGKKHLSLIVGGWGGGVCGISSLDGNDASENETTTYRRFKNKTWYPVRLRVTEEKIEAWLEGKKIVDVKTKGKKLSLRVEVEPSKPFGFSTWQTTGALRKIRIRELPAAKPQAKQ